MLIDSTIVPAACVAAAVGLLASGPAAAQHQTVLYRVELDSTWSQATHPTDWPGPSAHYSPLIGTAHDSSASLWAPGGIASPGVERVAETGATNVLRTEIEALIDAGSAMAVAQGPALNTTPDSIGMTMAVSSEFPLLSMITMIAPSPDWIVGVHDVELFNGSTWAGEIAVALDPYDAGTDSGVSYFSPNADVTPHDPIRNITDEFPFNSGGPLGTMRITYVQSLGCVGDVASPFGELNIDDVLAYIGAFADGSPVADLAAPSGTLNIDDVLAFLDSFAAGCG